MREKTMERKHEYERMPQRRDNPHIIEDGIYKAYRGSEKFVSIPHGVKIIGGVRSDKDMSRRSLAGDPIGYKAFYNNENVEAVELPSSCEEIGFKAFEFCSNLRVLKFSANMKKTECNSLAGCDKLKTLIFDGDILQLDDIDFDWMGGKPDLDAAYCNDGTLLFHREFYIEDYYYDGTSSEWNENMSDHWLNRRAKRIHFKE